MFGRAVPRSDGPVYFSAAHGARGARPSAAPSPRTALAAPPCCRTDTASTSTATSSPSRSARSPVPLRRGGAGERSRGRGDGAPRSRGGRPCGGRKEGLGTTNTAWARAASAVLGPGDPVDSRVADTLSVGCGLVDEHVARAVAEGGLEAIATCASSDVFDALSDGTYDLSMEAVTATRAFSTHAVTPPGPRSSRR